MKGKIFKRATVTFLALSMVGTSLLADIGIVGLSEDFSLTANAADTETVTLHFFDSATSKLEDINIPIDSEYTFRSPLEVFKSDKIPDGYRFKYWKLSGSDTKFYENETITMTQEYYQQNFDPYDSIFANDSDFGGGVNVDEGATFIMNGGEINVNSATYGAGVYLDYDDTSNADMPKFSMTGGSITDNYAADTGGGVYAYSEADISVSGNVTIQNNTDEFGDPSNLCFDRTFTTINISDHLDANSKIGITLIDNTGGDYNEPFTSGLNGLGGDNKNGDETNFTSDEVWSNVALLSTGEASLTDQTSERLYGYSLSLDGDIGVNFYIKPDDEAFSDTNASMIFTVNSSDDSYSHILTVSQADEKEIGGTTYRVFKCRVSAKEMTSDIRAQIVGSSYDPTNPINRYCEIHTITDNFATTALTEKVIYALDIESQLDRALSYLVLLDGEDNEKVNIDLMKNAYFPDPEEGATNKDNMPFCYLMNGYTYVQGKNNYIRYDINDGQALYGTEARKKNGKIVTLSDEDIAEFGRRMNGRTMLEEMMLAGYKESDLKFEVQEKKPFYGVYPNGIHGTSGIAFKFENVQCDKSKVELLWNKEQYMFGKYLQKIAPATWLYGDDERAIFPAKNETDKYFAIVTKGINWNQTTMGDHTACIDWDKRKYFKCDPGTLFKDTHLYIYKR